MGEFKNEMKEGFGIYLSKNYNYEGEFKENRIEGYGKLYNKIHCTHFIGEFVNGIPTGYGKLKQRNGKSISGKQVNGFLDKYGIIKKRRSDNGGKSEYIGEIKINKYNNKYEMSGFGIFKGKKNSSNYHYIGFFKNEFQTRVWSRNFKRLFW